MLRAHTPKHNIVKYNAPSPPQNNHDLVHGLVLACLKTVNTQPLPWIWPSPSVVFAVFVLFAMLVFFASGTRLYALVFVCLETASSNTTSSPSFPGGWVGEPVVRVGGGWGRWWLGG